MSEPLSPEFEALNRIMDLVQGYGITGSTDLGTIRTALAFHAKLRAENAKLREMVGDFVKAGFHHSLCNIGLDAPCSCGLRRLRPRAEALLGENDANEG